MTFENFLIKTPWGWLKQYPRFLQAINYRIEKLSSTYPGKDRSQTALIEAWWARWQEADQHLKTQATVDPELDKLRWMIEEFRVSLFAQPLGTSLKVSETRLQKQLDKVQR